LRQFYLRCVLEEFRLGFLKTVCRRVLKVDIMLDFNEGIEDLMKEVEEVFSHQGPRVPVVLPIPTKHIILKPAYTVT